MQIKRMHFVDLDVVRHEDETIKAACEDLIGAVAASPIDPISFDVIQEHGPASGWPLVRFHGSRDALEVLLQVYGGAAYQSLVHETVGQQARRLTGLVD